MTKKLVKALLATVTCATIVVGGASVGVHAMSDKVRVCDHSYYLLEDSGGSYEKLNSNDHIFYYWEEIFCMDCMAYLTNTGERVESHVYNGDDICDDCGYVRID